MTHLDTESWNQVIGLLFWFNETISLTQLFLRLSYNIYECKTFPSFISYASTETV